MTAVRITVNGKEFLVEEHEIHYRKVLSLAFSGRPARYDCPVSYSGGPDGSSGVLSDYEQVSIVDGMWFNAAFTGIRSDTAQAEGQ